MGLYRKMNIPAIQHLETWQTFVFHTTKGKRYLMAQSGAPDGLLICGWDVFRHVRVDPNFAS
jgi:hypothetical protein